MVRTKICDVVMTIIKGAGELLRNQTSSDFSVTFKSKADMVTSVDKAIEGYIVERLQAAFADFPIFSEEVGLLESSNTDYLWVIDPLDGTTNFVHGFPYYCISIALTHKEKVIFGAVNDVPGGAIFHATRGGGAFVNGTRIRVSSTSYLADSLIVTGFAAGDQPDNEANMLHFTNAIKACQAVRRTGSAALDLCNVACGRLDAYVQKRINAYDIAAGSIIVEEAGGKVTNLDGKAGSLHSGEILASNGLIHEEMVRTITLA